MASRSNLDVIWHYLRNELGNGRDIRITEQKKSNEVITILHKFNMKFLPLYFIINFIHIQLQTYSFNDYVFSSNFDVLYILCSRPEILATVWVGLATLYSGKYLFGLIMWMYVFTIIKIIMWILFLQVISVSLCLFLIYNVTMELVYESEEVKVLEEEIMREIERNELPYANFQDYVRHLRSPLIFFGNGHDERMDIVLSAFTDRIYCEIKEFLCFTNVKHFKAKYQHLEMECCICQCAFEYDEKLTKSFKCSHVLHLDCCMKFLKHNVAGKCPLCRSSRQ